MSDSVSRRSFLRLSATTIAVGASLPLLSACDSKEPAQAASVTPAASPAATAEAANGPVFIGSNEHPDGPSPAARQAAADIVAEGGRYGFQVQRELYETYAAAVGVKPEYIVAYAGSTPALDYAVLAFTSATAGLVTANPSYEQPWRAAERNGASVIKVPLREDYSHDVEAMIAANPDAGIIYICNPNNPTGSVTTRADIEYALRNKPQGSILIVDEAYIEFSDTAVSAVDLVAADEDVVVLRTFSKLYGMAGLRLGFAIARPDLLEKIKFFGMNSLPVTAAAAGVASLKDPALIPERRKTNTALRLDVVSWLENKGYTCSKSESNCFLVDVKQPAREFIAAMREEGVFIGRSWEVWPTMPRITVGNATEIERFKEAFTKVEARFASAQVTITEDIQTDYGQLSPLVALA